MRVFAYKKQVAIRTLANQKPPIPRNNRVGVTADLEDIHPSFIHLRTSEKLTRDKSLISK